MGGMDRWKCVSKRPERTQSQILGSAQPALSDATDDPHVRVFKGSDDAWDSGMSEGFRPLRFQTGLPAHPVLLILSSCQFLFRRADTVAVMSWIVEGFFFVSVNPSNL